MQHVCLLQRFYITLIYGDSSDDGGGLNAACQQSSILKLICSKLIMLVTIPASLCCYDAPLWAFWARILRARAERSKALVAEQFQKRH